MKNWRTTLIGAALAVLTVIASHTEGGASLTEWKTYMIPALLALFGYLAKDAGVTGGLKALALLLLPLCLCQCATEQSTDAELRRAQGIVEAARFSYELAEVVYRPRLESPNWSPAEKAVAEKIITKTRERLEAEQARLVDIQRAREAAAVAARTSGEGGPPASPLLPALTGAK